MLIIWHCQRSRPTSWFANKLKLIIKFKSSKWWMERVCVCDLALIYMMIMIVVAFQDNQKFFFVSHNNVGGLYYYAAQKFTYIFYDDVIYSSLLIIIILIFWEAHIHLKGFYLLIKHKNYKKLEHTRPKRVSKVLLRFFFFLGTKNLITHRFYFFPKNFFFTAQFFLLHITYFYYKYSALHLRIYWHTNTHIHTGEIQNIEQYNKKFNWIIKVVFIMSEKSI